MADLGYSSQHYRLVGSFTAYLEAIAGRTPDPEVRRLLRDILEDEYMRPQAFERSHPALYRRFMRAVGFEEGAWDRVPTLPAMKARVAGSAGTWSHAPSSKPTPRMNRR